MPQPLPVDRPGRRAYLGPIVAAITVGCAHVAHIAPAKLAPLPADSARTWTAARQPMHALHYTLTWHFRNQKGESGGRAAVRVAPPDTLRFDYRGPFGKSGSAVVVGDSALWSRPETDVDQLIPAAPLFWAALGVPIAPASPDSTFGLETTNHRIWRYVSDGTVIDYVEERGTAPRLRAEVRHDDHTVGISEVDFDPATGAPTQAVMTFPAQASQFRFTVERIDTVAAFDADTWLPH